jgi:type 1 fimbria pilin
MAASLIGITEGVGKNLRTWQRTVSSSAVEEQFIILGDSPKATYSVVASAISTATSASHILQIMAGSTLYVKLEKLRIKQVANAGAVAMVAIQVLRLTSAGTGGSAVTPRPHDTSDTAGATAMTLPSSKGTEGVQLDLIDFPLRAAILGQEQEYVWTLPDDVKPFIIEPGTTNGLCLKVVTGVASATLSMVATISETAEK